MNPKLRARSSRNKSSKLREVVAYLSPKSQRTPMDKESLLDNYNKRKNAELYASTNNKAIKPHWERITQPQQEQNHCRI